MDYSFGEELPVNILLNTTPVRKGKVKDVYELKDKKYLLFHFTNRISVFDKIIPSSIPLKGESLCRTTAFWFKIASKLGFKNHFIECPTPTTMKVKRVEIIRDYDKITQKSHLFLIPLEFIARYYVAGSLYYRLIKKQILYQNLGFKNPPSYGDALPEPYIEVTTKLEDYDKPVTKNEALKISSLNSREYDDIIEIILKIDSEISKRALKGGLIHVDGKKEFALDGQRDPMIVDTFGTADEDRFWEKKIYEEGKFVELSKEYVRRYYRSIGYYAKLQKSREAGKDEPPIPPLPREVILSAKKLYIELYERLTGERF